MANLDAETINLYTFSAVNIITLLGNTFVSLKLTSIKTDHELISYWKERAIKAEDVTKEQHRQMTKLEARVRTYEQFHKHEPLHNL